MRNFKIFLRTRKWTLTACAWALMCSLVHAQFSTPPTAPVTGQISPAPAPAQLGAPRPFVASPGMPAPPHVQAPGVYAPTLQAPAPLPYDPYNRGGYPQTTLPAQTYGAPALSAPPAGTPFGTPPPAYPTGPGTLYPGASPYGAPVPQPPNTYSNWVGPGTMMGPAPSGPYLKFFQATRLRYTWLVGGNSGRDLGINDIDTSLTAAFPGFLGRQEAPLYLTPGFSLHLWDGPVYPSTALPAAGPATPDLPGSAYSVYLDTAWNPYLTSTKQVSAELGFRVGIYTDFNTFNTDSVRYQGRGYGVFRVNPVMTIKGGIIYLDRADIKMLPAGGIIWEPDQFTKFDILFPNPKLSKFLTTVGLADIWWYLAGEYGGDSWTIERTSGASDRIDINDFRIVGGLEWKRRHADGGLRTCAFLELGYVFEREVVYVSIPSDTFRPRDTLMLRGGLSF